MEDKNLVNKPVDVEQIIEALRCIASDGLAGCCDCETCPFPEEVKLSNSVSIEHCNSDGILRAAADRLANDQTNIAALQKEIEKLRSDRRWIPVTERLPEDRSDVLVVAYWHERWGVYMGWCAPKRAAWSVHIGIGDRNDVAVTHWMPLPEPPEVEK